MLITGIVEFVNTQHRRHSATYCLVLVRGDVPAERYHQTEPRLFCRVLVCGIHGSRVSEEKLPVGPQVGIGKVCIQAEDGAMTDIGAATVVAVATHKSSHVLDLTLLIPAHCLILGNGLGGSCLLAESVKKLRPLYGLVLPGFCFTVVTERHVEGLIVLDDHTRRSSLLTIFFNPFMAP